MTKMTPTTPKPTDVVIARETVPSGNIRSIGHANGVMDIEFHGGKVYRYTGPKVTDHYNAIMKADSKGKYFTQHIRHCKDTNCISLNADAPK